MHEAAYVVEGVADLGPGDADELAGALGVGVDGVAGRLQPERDPAEDRTEPVVQVAADPAAVVLAADHEPLPALLELGRQQPGPDGDGGLPHEVDEQALVAVGQHRAEPLHRQHQPPDALALVGDVDLLHLRGRGPVRRGQQAAVGREHVDADVPDLEGVGDRAGEGGQLLVDGAGRLEPGGQRRHGAVAVAAAAQQQAAYEPAEQVRSGP